MPGAGGGSNFFLAKGSKAEAAKKRKAAAGNSRKGSLVKTKPKAAKKGKTFDTGSGLKKRRAEEAALRPPPSSPRQCQPRRA